MNMTIRILPDSLIDQIAAGEVVERPASVVKELIENSLDGGADQIVVDIADGGRTLISVMDNGRGMNRDDLDNCIKRHATSKLPDHDLLNISFMGFRGEALPSIASVSDMTIDTNLRITNYDLQFRESNRKSQIANRKSNGWQLNCDTGEIKPSAWESGTRVRVENLFAKTPARLKFLRSDRAEMMSIVEVVKRLAMARPDVGFILSNKWRFPKDQPLIDRIASVMGEEVVGRMIEVGGRRFEVGGKDNLTSNLQPPTSNLKLTGFVSEPTLRRASSIDQYLFVNGRPVKDKVLVGALRAAYMDVMQSREFPLAALYLELSGREVDVNVSPAKTEVHFLEPSRVRGFIIKTLRDALAAPLAAAARQVGSRREEVGIIGLSNNFDKNFWEVRERAKEVLPGNVRATEISPQEEDVIKRVDLQPLGRVIGQIDNKYILAQNAEGLVIVDQHAAHERIVYEKLRKHEVKRQSLLLPIIVKMKPEAVLAVLEIAEELKNCGIIAEQFGDDAVAIQEKPADWDLDWGALMNGIAEEVLEHGHSSQMHEKLHLKLANYACHHSVRAGQGLDASQMDALLREIENTERGGECNHGRPVYRIIPLTELDAWFER
ncbi:MAG: DNA mismatch repair endonuclease MutL [Alphaproteobacteria bacterium]|nr:DNA mismatch repair endonuclease MutL [Alphaproteobacteria bacterium]